MRTPDWQTDDGAVRLYLGDCLEILPELRESSVQCLVADPPYGINTKSDGQGKLSPWADYCNAALWYREWLSECRRVLHRDGCMWSFLNWRSLTTFTKASCDVGWPIESLLVWDKCWIGPGGSRGLRPSYELVALWAMPGFSIENRGLPDIQRFMWSSQKPTGHPAEKPEPLVRFLIENSSHEGEIVLDTCLGSGTAGAAAQRLKRQFWGIELDKKWFDYSVARLGEPPLFEPAPAIQRSMFAEAAQ